MKRAEKQHQLEKRQPKSSRAPEPRRQEPPRAASRPPQRTAKEIMYEGDFLLESFERHLRSIDEGAKSSANQHVSQIRRFFTFLDPAITLDSLKGNIATIRDEFIHQTLEMAEGKIVPSMGAHR